MSTQVTAPLPKARTHVPDHPENAPHHGVEQVNGDAAPEQGHDAIDLNVPRPRSGWIIAIAITFAVILAVLLIVGLLPRIFTNRELAANADAALNAPVPVNVIAPRRGDRNIDVLLPGTLRPWQEVSIYSRSSGYLKEFVVDISSQVKKGQLMATISTPEVDQQLNAAIATLRLQEAARNKAGTDLAFAKKTNERYQSLRGTNGVTQLELDQYEANYNAALATFNQSIAQVGVAQANVQQLTEMQLFEKIIAPFSGVVTGRAYDVGAYIIANPTTMDIAPMFKIAENDVLRAFINVPQNYALAVKMGQKVTISAREVPNREFTGKVLGTTNYLDLSARSLLTEIRIENPDFALLPGMYIQANFHMPREHPPLLVPGPALVINADGKQVAIVRDGKVHFQKVTLGVDFGNDIEIISGLTGSEQVIANPGERTVEDAKVNVVGETKTPEPDGTLKERPEKVAEVAK